MAEKNNLIPMNERTADEQREITRNAGIASGKARRRNKTMREIAKMIGDKQHPSDKLVKQLAELMRVNENDVTHNLVVISKQFQKAEQGDTKSAEYIAKMQGELVERSENEIILPKINLEAVGGTDE